MASDSTDSTDSTDSISVVVESVDITSDSSPGDSRIVSVKLSSKGGGFTSPLYSIVPEGPSIFFVEIQETSNNNMIKNKTATFFIVTVYSK